VFLDASRRQAGASIERPVSLHPRTPNVTPSQ
jgi:hypothetical protein